MHCYGENSYFFVNGKKIVNIKVNHGNVNFLTQFCLGVISNKFGATESREVSLKRTDFSVDYNATDKSDILNIQKYLMVKNMIIFWLIVQVFIGFLCFSKSLSSIANTPDHVKCISLNA